LANRYVQSSSQTLRSGQRFSTATFSHTADQKIATPMAGLRIQLTQAMAAGGIGG
jgi:hypothetical protein